MKKALLLLLLISHSTFCQINIDEIVSVKFQESPQRVDTIAQGLKIDITYVKDDIKSYSVTKMKIDSKKDVLTDLPHDENSLKKLYVGLIKGQTNRMIESGYELKDSKIIYIDNFLAYRTEYLNEESKIKNAEFTYLVLNEDFYVFGYINHVDFNESQKEEFLNSIAVNSETNPTQFAGYSKSYKWGYIAGKVVIYGGLILLVIWIIRKSRKK